ncbi:MAG: SDR family NAD(P)-dependent oxidoreductase [Proteobacteria bacterium]|nr:SDR family NAD(P)-dependent oxidoreductase [Pseudomonadota bacterium]
MAALAGRTALITGASRGIGRAVAIAFAAEGARVILVARTKGGLEEVDDEIRRAGRTEGATLVPMDLGDLDQIDRLGAAVFERFGGLDVLVGNAAVLGALSPMGHYAPKQWDEVTRINVTANWRLIRIFDPVLRRSPAGRAIFVTSGVAASVFPYWGAYAASKAALEMMVKVWASEVTKTTLRINLLDPGVVRTRMRAQAFPGEDPMTLPPPESVAPYFVELASAACRRHGEVVRAY